MLSRARWWGSGSAWQPGCLGLLACGFLLACSTPPPWGGPSWEERPSPHGSAVFPNWPASPQELESLFRGSFEIRSMDGAQGGTTGAKKVEYAFAGREEPVAFKWKPLPWRQDGINNSPRKEMAAYEIQKLFLEPRDFLVPMSGFRCIPLSIYGEHSRNAKPTFSDSTCVLGLLSVWLIDVTLPDQLYDPERFADDYVYAYYMANFNLLTYLIAHHDGREGNFLVSKDDARRQVFAIDNGVSFGGIFYNWFVPNWNNLRVPALRRESIERLRGLKEEDVVRLLGVVAQLERNADGVYERTEQGENLEADDGVRVEGRVVQFGLTDDEIKDVWERIEDLIEAVDAGRVSVF